MKRMMFSLLMMAVLFVPGIVFPAEQCNSSGLKTTDQAITARAGVFCGVEIITDGTNAATVIVYDHATSASGTVLFKGTIAGANNFGGGFVYVPNRNGIYVDVTGTDAAYIIYFQ